MIRNEKEDFNKMTLTDDDSLSYLLSEIKTKDGVLMDYRMGFGFAQKINLPRKTYGMKNLVITPASSCLMTCLVLILTENLAH